ncbi:MAG: hypothetical protein IKW11_03510 [Bacteroidales bacterium]|nr:hypothetical protein [Bacteroidales bacterium]
MKTNFWKFAAAFVVGLAAVVACDKPEPEPVVVDPVFPETVLEENVEAGATVEVSFEANLDWELSIPAAEQNKYWLDDAGVPASKVSGKAGSQTVSVVFSEDVYYDANVLCEVTLTMGGQSKVIAKLTRLAINRALEVYVAEKSDWAFKTTYGTEKATALELTTFTGDVTYTLPIQVVANYDWSLALPEWCAGSIKDAETLSGKAGQVVEILLTGNVTESVKAGATGAAKFIDATDNNQSEELPLAFPAFADRIEWSEPSSMNFDHTGVSAMPAIGYVLGMQGYVIKALEWKGQWHDTAYADWVTVTPGEATEGLLQQAAVTLGVTANEGHERYADLFLFPASMANVKAEDICEANDACSIKAQYEKYYIGRLTQAGVPMPFIVPVYPSDQLEAEGVYFTDLEPKGEDNIMQWDIEGAESYHKITYTSQWSYESANFSINKPFATCKFYEDTQYPEGFFTKEVTPDWIELWTNPDKSMGKFNMLYTPSSPIHIAAVFFDENGGKVAAVLVEYNPAGGGASAALELSVMQGEAQISTLAPETELYQILAGNLGVTTVFEVQAAGDAIFQLSQPFAMASVFDMTLNTSTAVACECFDQNYVMVSPQPGAEVVIILKNEQWVNVAAIHYTCSNGGGSSAPTVNPEEFFDFLNMSGNPVITAMDPSSELYKMLAGNVGCTNLMVVNANTNIVLTGTAAHPYTSVDIYDMNMSPTTTPNKMFQPVNNGMVMIFAPAVSGTECLLVFKNGEEIVSICHYIYTI